MSSLLLVILPFHLVLRYIFFHSSICYMDLNPFFTNRRVTSAILSVNSRRVEMWPLIGLESIGFAFLVQSS
jgi:hypothetical protein